MKFASITLLASLACCAGAHAAIGDNLDERISELEADNSCGVSKPLAGFFPGGPATTDATIYADYAKPESHGFTRLYACYRARESTGKGEQRIVAATTVVKHSKETGLIQVSASSGDADPAVYEERYILPERGVVTPQLVERILATNAGGGTWTKVESAEAAPKIIKESFPFISPSELHTLSGGKFSGSFAFVCVADWRGKNGSVSRLSITVHSPSLKATGDALAKKLLDEKKAAGAAAIARDVQ